MTGHLLGGMTLLLLLRWQHVRLNGAEPIGSGDTGLKPWAWLTLMVLYLQLGLGAWVSSNYAVLACQDFPTCQGSWWPEMDFTAGFELWRPLGMDGTGQPIVFAALTAIHFTHRWFAFVVLALIGWVGFKLRREPHTRVIGHALWALGVWQLLSGVSNVVLQWPLLAALAHTAGAAAMVIVITGWLARHYVKKDLL
jgi:cytochrome c oxidase assembly protein subunit 15